MDVTLQPQQNQDDLNLARIFYELFANKPPALKIQNKIDQIAKQLSDHCMCHG
jgi:50S ribosomal subunit-associated GTPase HflX